MACVHRTVEEYWSAALLEGAKIGTASFLHYIERDDYTDKRYVD
jgi:hypothetical protein